MEYLVTMTTRLPDGPLDETVQDLRAGEAVRANWRRKDTCFASGVRRCNRANGERSACSQPTTTAQLEHSSPRCHYASGAPTRSSGCRRTRATQHPMARMDHNPSARRKPWSS
jgi:hypothetical protein